MTQTEIDDIIHGMVEVDEPLRAQAMQLHMDRINTPEYRLRQRMALQSSRSVKGIDFSDQ